MDTTYIYTGLLILLVFTGSFISELGVWHMNKRAPHLKTVNSVLLIVAGILVTCIGITGILKVNNLLP